MAKVKVGDYEYDSRSVDGYVAPYEYVAPDEYLPPPGAPTVAAPAPKEASMQARALAEILSQVRYTVADSGDNEGDPSTLLPKFYANRNAANLDRYGSKYTPSERFNNEVDPSTSDGAYLYNLYSKLGPGVADAFAIDGSDSDEDMMARNMTKFMRNYKDYVPEDDLALALAEIYGTDPGAAPGQTGSRGQPGQSDKAGSVGGANTPGATVGGMFSGGSNAANVFGTVGMVNFGRGLYNSMKYGHYAGPGYGKLDKYGNVIPGTYKGGAGYSDGRTGFTGPGGQTGQAGTGSDGVSGGGGGITT